MNLTSFFSAETLQILYVTVLGLFMYGAGMLGYKNYQNRNNRANISSILSPLVLILISSTPLSRYLTFYFYNNPSSNLLFTAISIFGSLVGILWLFEVIIKIYKEYKSETAVIHRNVFNAIGATFLLIFGFVFLVWFLLSFYLIATLASLIG